LAISADCGRCGGAIIMRWNERGFWSLAKAWDWNPHRFRVIVTHREASVLILLQVAIICDSTDQDWSQKQ